jgi:hypothetical protein
MGKNLRERLKTAWFQGADEATKEGEITSNNPKTLGYPKEIAYPHKPMETTAPGGQDSRPWEQKWFEGAAAETKKVMGPQGEEFKLKQKMQRIPMDEKVANAKLSVAFTRTAKPQSSHWSVFATDKKSGKKELVLKANLDQIWGPELNEENANMTASKEYGQEIIARIRKMGVNKVAELLTGKPLEEVAPVATASVKKAQMAMAPAMHQEELPVGEAVEVAAGEDAGRADATVSELEAKKGEIEMAETKLIELLPEQAAAAGRELQAVEEAIEGAIEENKEIAARLRDRTISASAKVAIMKIAQEAFDAAADEVLPGADATLQSTESLIEQATEAIAKVDQVVEEEGGAAGAPVEGGAPLEGGAPVSAVEVAVPEEGELSVASIKNFLAKRADLQKKAMAEEQKYGVVPEGAPKDGKGEIDSAHPNGGTEIGNLTVGLPVENKGDRFETVTEGQDHDLKVADKMPTGELNSTIAVASNKGRTVKANENGQGTDQATKSYYHELYDQMGPEGKKFADELTASYDKKVSAAVAETEGRVKRAFELAEVAASKGFCEANAKLDLFSKIAKFDDNAFMAFKEAVESMPAKKVFATEASDRKTVTASMKLPVVGQNERVATEGSEDFSSLGNLGWN